MEDSELVQITVKLPAKMKNSFEKMCKERGINMSAHIRDLMTNSVRSYTRKSGKTEKEEE